MKARIHEGHLGIEQCKTRARECLFWPGMTSEIADMVSWCETCIQSGRKQLREPLIPLPLATLAWNRVACDLFDMNGRDYLLIVDYFTSYPEVTLLTETASSAIIGHTKSIFARHGIPDTVITDHGPLFTSTEYRDFAKQWEFKHTTSSPLHPRPNGKVKRTVCCVVTRRSLISQRTQAIFLLSSKFFSEVDPTLPAHLQIESISRVTYLSPQSQNEMIDVIGKHYIQKKLVKEILESKYYAILADEATSHNEKKLALVIRFIDANKDIRVEFLEFKDLERTTEAAVSAVLLATLTALNIPIKDCYGQGYDGAASMSNERVGIQANNLAHAPKGVYVHCASHCLILLYLMPVHFNQLET